MKKTDPIVYVLRRYRENKGISQDKMSTLTGMSVSTIQRIENGRTDMKLSQYRSYLNVLNMSDMDVSIALFSHEFVTEKDVAAIARQFPLKVKRVIIRFLDELAPSIDYRTDRYIGHPNHHLSYQFFLDDLPSRVLV